MKKTFLLLITCLLMFVSAQSVCANIGIDFIDKGPVSILEVKRPKIKKLTSADSYRLLNYYFIENQK
jgi:hypothetical protein